MAGATPLKATFFAFKPRERGGVLVRATVAYIAVAIFIFTMFSALNWRLFPPVVDWYFGMLDAISAGENGELLVGEIPPELFFLMPSYVVVMFASVLLFASYEAACLRWLIHGEVGGLFGLTLNADTWRVWLIYWAWGVGFVVIYTLLASAVFAFIFGLGAITGGAALMATPLLLLGVYGALIAFAVRTAPAAATTIARRRFSFFKAWTVSRGRFWPLLGSFVLIGVIGVAVILVLYAVGLGTIFAASGVSFRDLLSTGDREAIRDAIAAVLMTPRALAIASAYYLVLVAFSLTLYVAMFGVNARAAKLALEEGRI